MELSAEPACRGVDASAWDPALVEVRSGSADEARVPQANDESAPSAVGEAGRRTIANETARTDQEAQALAQAHLDLRVHREAVIRGVAEGNPILRAGALVTLRGVAERGAGPHVLGEVTHTIDTVRSYLTEFSSETTPPPSPVAGATVAFGLVTSVGDPDEHGRVKVSLPSCGNLETDWMQVLLPAAGRGKGVIAMPDVDDRVLVLFVGGEASHGVVLGGLYGPSSPPDSGVDGGRTRRLTFCTPGGQRLCLDDRSDLARLENSDHSYLEFSPEAVELHASRDLHIDAPGKSIVISGAAIDFKEACMFLLTDEARLECLHRGRVSVAPSQRWVTVEGYPVQVEPDPVGKSISACPNVGLMIRPCTVTLLVVKGYSSLLRIGGRRVCLDLVSGVTDGTPPGTVEYVVRDPGQHLVSEQ